MVARSTDFRRVHAPDGKGNERSSPFRIVGILLFLALLASSRAAGQDGGDTVAADSLIDIDEELDLAIFDEQSVSPELAAWLEELRRHPIDLASGTPEELALLPGITRADAARIMTLVDSLRPEGIAAIVASGALDDEVADALRMYTSVGKRDEDHGWTVEIRSRVTFDLQRSRGFRERLHRIDMEGDTVDLGPHYLGPPGGVTTRVLAANGRYRAGLLVDRDPGEPALYRDTLRFTYRQNESVGDTPERYHVRSGTGLFLSGFASAAFDRAGILLGDYTLSFGSGLLFGRPFSGRKGGSPARDPLAGPTRVRPHTSRSESGYFRGVVVRGDLPLSPRHTLGATLFASRRFHDGAIRVDDREESPGVSLSIDEAGELATRGDLRRDDRIEEVLGGGHVEVRGERGSVGFTLYGTKRTGRPVPGIDSSAGHPDLPTDFPGSLDWSALVGPLEWSGEIARGAEGWGVTTAVRTGDRAISGILAMRHLSRAFISPHAVTIAESPVRPDGETGLYGGIRLRLVERVSIEGYVDLYRQIEDDPTWPFPSLGAEVMARLRWRVRTGWEVESMARHEVEESGLRSLADEGRNEMRGVPEESTTLRIGLRWRSDDERLRFRTRLEGRRAATGDSGATGLLLMADLRWRPEERIRIGARWTTFDADPGVIHYGLEQELPGNMALAALSGRGSRYTLLIARSFSEQFDLGIRFGETRYADRRVIRPGTMREIEGRRTGSLSLQADYRL